MLNTTETQNLDEWFLTDSEKSNSALQHAVDLAMSGLSNVYANQKHVYSGIDHNALKQQFNKTAFAQHQGMSLKSVQQQTNDLILKHSLNLGSRKCLAHLHCPPLIPAISAELTLAAMNQSMDSWDQSPAASVMEQFICDWLCNEFDFPKGDSTFTSGGTQSNQMGLLLARNKLIRKRLNQDCQKTGLPAEATSYRVFCSEVAHFSIKQSMSILGLGSDSIVQVKTDNYQNMDVQDLRSKIAEQMAQGNIPMAICATAGTTDFGSIDPLQTIAATAHEYGIWLHVDAAYGGVLQVLPSLKDRLTGIDQADSVTVDFHKFFYQPISSSAFLVKNAQDFSLIQLNADYLNPLEDEEIGLPNLVTKSIQTTRRFDALKLYMSLQHIGIGGLEAIVHRTLDLADSVAELIKHDERFELANTPSLNAVVFRWVGKGELHSSELDSVNQQASQVLIMKGLANIAKTRYENKAWLKFTLLNPQTELEDIAEVLNDVHEEILVLSAQNMEQCA